MEGELSSFGSFYVNEEVDFMAQLFPNTNDQHVGCYDYNVEGGTYYFSSESTPNSQNVCYLGQESGYRREHESNYSSNISDVYQHHDQFSGLNDSNMEESLVGDVAVDRNCDSSDDSKKRARVTDIIMDKRYIGCGGGEVETEFKGRSLTSGSPNNEDRRSKKTNTSLSSHGRTRASRGSATDPQSIYARKRRERINERLRILQSLVPNGTKVDISTMLEEAVHYVKFLQLQIKLLSSDDHWMYAPITYNGLNIGLDFNVNIP